MLFRIFQYFGILVIILFCSFSIFVATSERDIISYNSNSILSYASFFEDRFFDLRMKLTLDKKAVDNRIVLAAIDDHSLNKIGRWPWTRTKIANVIDKLNTYGAKILAFDVFFSEPEVACNKVSPDIELVESIKRFQTEPGRKVIIPFSVDIKYSNEIDEENF